MPVTIPPFTNVPAPGDPVASPWAQQLTQFAVDQYVAQPNQPTGTTELWYDTDDAGSGFPNMPRGYVGHANATASNTGIGSTEIDITGLTVTFTADPTRRYKTTLVTYRIDQFTATGTALARITDGSNASKASNQLTLTANAFGFITCTAIETGLSGSQTRKGRIATTAGSATLQTNSLLLVEDIGDAGQSGGGAGSAIAVENGSWTPSFTLFNPGTGATVYGTYSFIGGTAIGSVGNLLLQLMVTLGTGFTAWGSGHRWSIPPGFNWQPWNHDSLGVCTYEDTSAGTRFYGRCSAISPTLISAGIYAVSGIYIQDATMSGTIPFTWAAGDKYSWLINQRAVRV